MCAAVCCSLEEARGEFLSVLQVLDDFGTTIDRRGLFFDPHDFRANTQVRIRILLLLLLLLLLLN